MSMSMRVCVSDLSVGCSVPGLAASVVAVVGPQGGVLERSVGGGGRGSAAAVRMPQTLTVLLVDLQHNSPAL